MFNPAAEVAINLLEKSLVCQFQYYIFLRLQAAVLPQFQQEFGLYLRLARIQDLVVGQQLAAVFFLQQRQIVSHMLEQTLRARSAVGGSIFPVA
jgi:hypothetical protein